MYRHLEALIFPTTLITVLSDHGEPFCPKCEEPFWPKDVHIHYEVEDIIEEGYYSESGLDDNMLLL